MMKRAAPTLAALLLFLCAAVAHAQVFDLTSYLNAATGQSAQQSMPASPVDLLYDATTYVPPFYKGRPLPSPGSTMRFQAIPHFGSVSDQSITYTWKVDGEVEGTLSGLGRSSVSLPSPGLFGSETVEVDAASQDGSAYGSASLSISSLDPGLTLYQDHPVFGVEYYNALGAQNSIADSEMTFDAVPYFVATTAANDPRLTYAWSVNGSTLQATSTNNNELTINAGNGGGFAAITVSLSSRANVLLDAQGAWNVTFSGSAFSKPNSTSQ